MKIVARYKTRVIADDDHNYLMSHGISSLVYGESGLVALKSFFKSDFVALAVKDIYAEEATKLLIDKRKKRKNPNWLIGF
jgi:hypothetical protein